MARALLSATEPIVHPYVKSEDAQTCEFKPAAPEAITWNESVTVDGTKDADCGLLSFGFCQNVVECDIEAVWVSGKKWRWDTSRKLPARDAAKDTDVAPWYSSDLSPNVAEHCGSLITVRHEDTPAIERVPFDEPGGAKL